MAIDYQTACMLWRARTRGVSFATTATVGHLSLFLHPAEVKHLRQTFRERFPDSSIEPLSSYKWGEYSDTFLREFLGVTKLTVMDYSSYEGADTVHDFNLPVPESLHGRFEAVIDGGTLEHVFNFPVALANLMELAAVGGSVFLSVPANNLCGHGFYQLSPELMFSVFTADNGFALQDVILSEAQFPSAERTSRRKVYVVSNPSEVRSRVMLIGRRPVIVHVEARKTHAARVFARPPLQSDYVSLWGKPGTNAFTPQGWLASFAMAVLRLLPPYFETRMRGYGEFAYYSLWNRRFYRRLRRFV